MFDRSTAARWRLTLAQTHVAAIDSSGESECRHHRAASVEIGRVDEWGARFGPFMRRLEELPGGHVTASWDRKVAPDPRATVAR